MGVLVLPVTLDRNVRVQARENKLRIDDSASRTPWEIQSPSKTHLARSHPRVVSGSDSQRPFERSDSGGCQKQSGPGSPTPSARACLALFLWSSGRRSCAAVHPIPRPNSEPIAATGSLLGGDPWSCLHRYIAIREERARSRRCSCIPTSQTRSRRAPAARREKHEPCRTAECSEQNSIAARVSSPLPVMSLVLGSIMALWSAKRNLSQKLPLQPRSKEAQPPSSFCMLKTQRSPRSMA